MAESEVETILREIRDRVLSQQRAAGDAATSLTADDTALSMGNGASDFETRLTAEKKALINSYLTTTARAWDRLPPLVSNRSGFSARLELWIKRHLKRATRWYAWEQVNFNAAVHHALRDMLEVLAGYEQEIQKLRTEAKVAADVRRIEFELNQSELASLHANLENQRLQLEAAIESLRRLAGSQRVQIEARLSDLLKELRERDEHLRDEQRVSFKQLALETSEAAVLEDRARRRTETLLEDLARRVQELEER